MIARSIRATLTILRSLSSCYYPSMPSMPQLHVFTARFNPLRWKTPELHFQDWVAHMLDSGVAVHVVECQYGERPFVCALPHIHHVGVRASSPCWTKENLINLGIQQAPEAEYIAWIDADVFYERAGWAEDAVHALQLYRWIQPWAQAIDRGPAGEVLNAGRVHGSFAKQYEEGRALIPDRHGWRADYSSPYPHPGFAWASTRRVLEYTGGLFELAGMGASDHTMALSLVGKASAAAPKGTNDRYMEHLLRWQARVQVAVHGRIGYTNQVINHRFHGAKANRQYLSRWEMFLRHGFNPDEDLKRNSLGVFEWAGNKPELEREWMLYLKSRNEDGNVA